MITHYIPAAGLFLAFATVCCQGKNHTWSDNSKLFVQIPSHLYDSHGSYHYRLPFGKYPRSKTHSDYVHYISNNLCFDFAPKNGTDLAGHPTQKPEGPFILMIDGGGCSAVKKARRAQEMGASALIVAEPHCLCRDDNCTKAFPADKCNNEQTPVTDDGSADDVTIPSFLIFKTLGQKLKDQMVKHKESVMVELQWDLETDLEEGSLPSIHFWTSTYDDKSVSVDTYIDMQVATNALAPYAKFEPRFVIFNGTDYGCPSNCGDLCTNGGRYCSVATPGTTGMQRMGETLRRLCVFNHFTLEQYWKYVLYHKENCSHEKEENKCWEKGFKHAGIHDHGKIEQCFKDNGGLENDSTNEFLETALVHIGRAGVMPYPALSVDRNRISVSATSL